MPTPDQIVAMAQEKKQVITTPQQAAETGQPIGSTVQTGGGFIPPEQVTRPTPTWNPGIAPYAGNELTPQSSYPWQTMKPEPYPVITPTSQLRPGSVSSNPHLAAEYGTPSSPTPVPAIPTGALVASNALQGLKPYTGGYTVQPNPSAQLYDTLTTGEANLQAQANVFGKAADTAKNPLQAFTLRAGSDFFAGLSQLPAFSRGAIYGGIAGSSPDVVGSAIGSVTGGKPSWSYLAKNPGYLLGDIGGEVITGVAFGAAFGAGSNALRVVSGLDIPILSGITEKLIGPIAGSSTLASVGRTAAGGAALSVGVSEAVSLGTSGQPLPIEGVLVAGALGAGVAGGFRAAGAGLGYVRENLPARPDWMSEAGFKDVFKPKPSAAEVSDFNKVIGGMENRTPRTFEDFKPATGELADFKPPEYKPIETGGTKQETVTLQQTKQPEFDFTGKGLEQYPLGKQRYKPMWETETTVLRYPPQTQQAQVFQTITGLDVGQRQAQVQDQFQLPKQPQIQVPTYPQPQLQRQPEAQLQRQPQIPRLDIPTVPRYDQMFRTDTAQETAQKQKAGQFAFPSLAIHPAEMGTSGHNPWKAWGYREFHAEIVKNPLGDLGKAMKKGRKK
jgi:hypothetical protein